MKLDLHTSTVEVSNLYQSQPFGIKPSEHAMELMSAFNTSKSLYNFVLNEIVANAVDATHGQVDRKIDVVLEKDAFRVRDNGSGMNPEDITKAIKIFDSNKSESNDFYGAFGIGLKTVFGISDKFFIQTVKNGVSYTWALEKTESKLPVAKLLRQENTTEPNGTEVVVCPNNKYKDHHARIKQNIEKAISDIHELTSEQRKRRIQHNYNYREVDNWLPPFGKDIPITLQIQNHDRDNNISTNSLLWHNLFIETARENPFITMGSRIIPVQFKDDPQGEERAKYKEKICPVFLAMANDEGRSIEEFLPRVNIGDLALKPGQTHVEWTVKQFFDQVYEPWKHLLAQGVDILKQELLMYLTKAKDQHDDPMAAIVAEYYQDTSKQKLKAIGTILTNACNWKDVSEVRKQEIVNFVFANLEHIDVSKGHRIFDWNVSIEDYNKYPELQNVWNIPEDLDIKKLIQNKPNAIGYSANGVVYEVPDHAVIVLLQNTPVGIKAFESKMGLNNHSIDVANFKHMNSLLAKDKKVPLYVNKEQYEKHPEHYSKSMLFEDWIAHHLTMKIYQEQRQIAEVLIEPNNLAITASYLSSIATKKGSHIRQHGLSYDVSPMFDTVHSVVAQIYYFHETFFESIGKRAPEKFLNTRKCTKSHIHNVARNLEGEQFTHTYGQYIARWNFEDINNRPTSATEAFHKMVTAYLTGKKKTIMQHAVDAQSVWETFQKGNDKYIAKKYGSDKEPPTLNYIIATGFSL